MSGRIVSIVIVGAVLWMLWGARIFWPAHQALPEGSVLLTSNQALELLPIGHHLVIEGKVYPADAIASENLWEGRFTYRIATWQKSEFGGQKEVVSHHIRPPLRFQWAGGPVFAPADAYSIVLAPAAPGNSLIHTTEHNVGFHIGEDALMFGRKTGPASIALDQLAIAPLEAYLATLDRDNYLRMWIGHGLRVVVSLLALSVLAGAMRREAPNEGSRSSPLT